MTRSVIGSATLGIATGFLIVAIAIGVGLVSVAVAAAL